MDGRITTTPVSEQTGEYAYIELLGRVKEALESAVEVSIAATAIAPFPGQPREHFDDEGIRRLSDSIDTGGQTTPGMIRLKPGATQFEMVLEKDGVRYRPGNSVFQYLLDKGEGSLVLLSHPGTTTHELIDGERRWRSVLLIPEDRRPFYKARMIQADDEVVRYLISGIANFNRQGHTPLETMETIDRLVGFGLPMREIANLLGVSEGWAGQIHGLKKLKPDVRILLDPRQTPKQKQLPLSAAIQISKIAPEFQTNLAARVLSKDISLGQLRGEVIKTAKHAGIRIRLREVSAGHQWASFGNKLDVMRRFAGDIESLLRNREIYANVKTKPEETGELVEAVKQIQEALVRIQKKILQIQKG